MTEQSEGRPRLRVVIVNHERTADALLLADSFRPHAEVSCIDSGSRLSPRERERFDLCLPNVYYSGLFNAAVSGCAELDDDDALLLVCSDVRVPDASRVVTLAREAFGDARTGVWGPSASGSAFRTMHNQGARRLRELPFVEGFCLAARLHLLRAVAPVDTRINPLGWGLDVHVALGARRAGLRCVIDDRVRVTHDFGSGYDQTLAHTQWKAWLATLPEDEQRGHALLMRTFSQSRLGAFLLRFRSFRASQAGRGV